MWRNSRLTTPRKRQSDCRRLGHSRLRVASRFTLRIGLASWPTQPPSQAKIAGGPPSLGVHEPSDSPQVTSCHSGTPLCDRPKLTKLSARGLCKLRAEHYWTCPLCLSDGGGLRCHRARRATNGIAAATAATRLIGGSIQGHVCGDSHPRSPNTTICATTRLRHTYPIR